MLTAHFLCIILYRPVKFRTSPGLLRGVMTSCVFEEGLLISRLFGSIEFPHMVQVL
jgi:hypothetical protein